MLVIEDLQVSIEGKPIIQGLYLKIQAGFCHVIMGPNGAGKSTLAKVLAGHPAYQITKGSILFKGQDLFSLAPEERAQLGLFMSFQYPLEISGVTNQQFLYAAVKALRKAKNKPIPSEKEFANEMHAKVQEMDLKPEFSQRGLNEGFSGGEKKKSEILQMSLLEPCLAILDETDSGLDIDSMRIVAAGIERMRTKENALLVITHYQRLLNYIQPDWIHVMIEGKIVRSGGKDLAQELEDKGYDWLKTC